MVFDSDWIDKYSRAGKSNSGLVAKQAGRQPSRMRIGHFCFRETVEEWVAHFCPGPPVNLALTDLYVKVCLSP